MKKVIIFILLSLAVVLTTGGYFFHKAHLISYKKEFKSFITSQRNNLPITHLVINGNELYLNTNVMTWLDENKEVYYKGKLYDVVSLLKQKDKIVLSLLSDENEQKLKEDFASIYNTDSVEKNSNKPIKLLKQFLGLKYISPTAIYFNKFNSDASAKPIISGNYKKTDVFLSQETPPPNLI